MKTVLSPSRTKRSLKTYRMVTEVMENYRKEEVGQSPLVLAKAPAVIVRTIEIYLEESSELIEQELSN